MFKRSLLTLAVAGSLAGVAAVPATATTASTPHDPKGCYTNPEYPLNGSYLILEGHCKGGASFRIQGRVLLGDGEDITITGPAKNARYKADGKTHGFRINGLSKFGGVQKVLWTRAVR